MISNGKQSLVLLVEDDALLANIMCRRLEQLHCDTRVAATAEEAVNLWSGMAGHLVLMDYRLPDGKGTEVVERMRAQQRDEPVIFMTAESESIPVALRQTLRIKDVLGKPVSTDALRQALAQAHTAEPVPVQRDPKARRYNGRFRILTLRGALSGARIARLYRAAQNERWVAVQVPATTRVTASAWRGLCAWAGWLSSRGGRLCVIAPSPDQVAYIQSQTNEVIDVVDSPDALPAHGFRLTSAAERSGLLGAILTRAGEG